MNSWIRTHSNPQQQASLTNKNGPVAQRHRAAIPSTLVCSLLLSGCVFVTVVESPGAEVPVTVDMNISITVTSSNHNSSPDSMTTIGATGTYSKTIRSE